MKSITHDQFSKVCRLCSTIHPQLKSISSHSIIKMIEECSPVHVFPGDDLPQSICEECLILLEKFILFRKTCLESETIFLKVYNESRKLLEPKTELPIPLEDVSKLEDIGVKNEVDEHSLKINLSEDDDGSEDNFLPDSDFSDSDSEPLIKLKNDSPVKSEDTDVSKTKRKRKFYVRKVGAFECNICGKVFTSHVGIGSHLHNRHKAKPFQCTICPKKFYYEPQFKLHERNHVVLKCEYCNKVFLAQCNFDEHLLTHGLQKPYGCLQCDGYFKNKRNLKAHMKKVHTRRKIMIECPVCRKSISKERLDHHMSTHGERKIFNCPVPDCSKTFYYQTTLDRHQKTVHEHQEESRNVLCNICGVAQKSKSALRRHLQCHGNDRPFACDQCTKTYKAADALKAHINHRHLNIRPYVCTECGSAFFTNRNLNNHKRIHTGEKPFICEVCDQAFSFQAGLYLHKQAHHVPKPDKLCKQDAEFWTINRNY